MPGIAPIHGPEMHPRSSVESDRSLMEPLGPSAGFGTASVASSALDLSHVREPELAGGGVLPDAVPGFDDRNAEPVSRRRKGQPVPLYRRLPFVIAMLGVVVLVAVVLFWLLMPTKPLLVPQAAVDSSGRDVLRLTCRKCREGGVITLDGVSGVVGEVDEEGLEILDFGFSIFDWARVGTTLVGTRDARATRAGIGDVVDDPFFGAGGEEVGGVTFVEGVGDVGFVVPDADFGAGGAVAVVGVGGAGGAFVFVFAAAFFVLVFLRLVFGAAVELFLGVVFVAVGVGDVAEVVVEAAVEGVGGPV